MYSSLDSLVRKAVYDQNRSIHYYLPFLSWALECLSEMNLDIDGQVKTVELSVDDLGLAKLPCNYIDWVRVGTKNKEYFNQFYSTNTFSNSLPMTDGVVTSPGLPAVDTDFFSGFNSYFYDFVSQNYENLGRLYGLGEATSSDSFQVMPELKAIRTSLVSSGGTLEMDYLTWEPVSASTEVHKYAESSILAFMKYKWEERQKNRNALHYRRMYGNELRKYRGRMNPFTAIDYAASLRRYRKQTPVL